jgi:hypothetical protein
MQALLLVFLLLFQFCTQVPANRRSDERASVGCSTFQGVDDRKVDFKGSHDTGVHTFPRIVGSFTTSFQRLLSPYSESFIKPNMQYLLGLPRMLLATANNTANRTSASAPSSKPARFLFDAIYLHIPLKYTARTKGRKSFEVRELPEWLSALADNSERTADGQARFIVTRPAQDLGPATKILPMMSIPNSELPPCSIVIQLDDDKLYDAIELNSLVGLSLIHPDGIYANLGWPIEKLAEHIDYVAWERISGDPFTDHTK